METILIDKEKLRRPITKGFTKDLLTKIFFHQDIAKADPSAVLVAKLIG